MIDEAPAQQLPFGAEWQRSFIAQIVEDEQFAQSVIEEVEPKWFEGEVLQWVWASLREYRRTYHCQPSWWILEELAKRLDERVREPIRIGIQQLRQTPLQEAEWVRRTALEWIRRSVFVRAFRASRDLYNAGKFEPAYDALMSEMDRFQDLGSSEARNESWLADELPARQARRWAEQTQTSVTPTGIPELDRLLGGGLDRGQLGILMAWSKVGKTSVLVNLGRVAARQGRQVAHYYFEGTHTQITNRYDASFSAELYASVRRGEFGSERYARLYQEYQFLSKKLWVKGFTERWDYSVQDIWDDLQRLRRRHGWVPDVVIVDYADLLHARGHYDNELDSNAAAYRDLKTLSTKAQGYAIWTAAQAKKPKDDSYDIKRTVLKAPDLGGRYEKVKVADVLASLNATLEERSILGVMRLWVEAVRDDPAGVEIQVPIEFERMLWGAGATPKQPIVHAAPPGETPPTPPQGRQPVLGYKQTGPKL